MKAEERAFHVLSAKLPVVPLEKRAQALPSILLRVTISSSRQGVRLLTPLQNVDHVVVTEVRGFVQRRVAPSVTRKTALE